MTSPEDMQGRVYNIKTGEDITPDSPPREGLSEAARSYYRDRLQHHEHMAKVYRQLLGEKAIESSKEQS